MYIASNEIYILRFFQSNEGTRVSFEIYFPPVEIEPLPVFQTCTCLVLRVDDRSMNFSIPPPTTASVEKRSLNHVTKCADVASGNSLLVTILPPLTNEIVQEMAYLWTDH